MTFLALKFLYMLLLSLFLTLGEPLIFIEVALLKDMAASIQVI